MISIADNMASEIRSKVGEDASKNLSNSFEKSLNILNAWSNNFGFMSSVPKEDDGSYSIISRSCVVHKVAVDHQDVICQGFDNAPIEKDLGGKKSHTVQLKECIAPGDNHSKHLITIS
jgi:predicted ArsR family transcriptional regulator